MKTLHSYLLVAAALLLTGCAIDRPQEYNPELRLMFQPEMYMHVAHEDVERFPTDETFGVAAWALPEGKTWEEDSDAAEEFIPLSEAVSMEVFITDTTLRDTVKDTLWGLSGQVNWPADHSSLTFFAYSPYDEACGCDKEDGISWSTDVAEEQTDLLYTRPHADMHKISNGWVVQLEFEHALSRIDFRIKHRVEDDEKITISRITIDAMRHKGVFHSLRTPQWTLEESLMPQTFFEGSEDAGPLPQPIGDYRMVVPQELDTFVTVEYRYTTFAGTYIVQKLRTVPLKTRIEPGRSYTYTLTVGIDDVKFMHELIEEDD